MIPGGFSERKINDFIPDNKIMIRIMESFKHNPKQKKTPLQQATQLRWNQFLNYLDWMIENNFLKYLDSELTVTPSGVEMFKALSDYYHVLHKVRS